MHFEGIDDGEPLVGGELNQAEFGQEAVFGDKLGVEGDNRRSRNRFAKVAKMLVGGDVVVIQCRGSVNEKVAAVAGATSNTPAHADGRWAASRIVFANVSRSTVFDLPNR